MNIFCHDLINPPTYDRSCDIDPQLLKSDGLIDFERKLRGSSESEYAVRISNIQQIGFTSAERALQYECRNLILACNLVTPRACMTDKKVEYLSLDLVKGHNESKKHCTKNR